MSTLDRVNSPDDLKALTAEEVAPYCEELREFLIESVSRTGGHMGSNLGVVELTVALHRVFDFQKDRLVLDTSHQVYPHKVITGRRRRFPTLRMTDGLSGFMARGESPYDTFTSGHAGTAVSQAAGMAWADHLRGIDDRKVVCVVGDASAGSGATFEALNHAGHGEAGLIVVLNDNQWSIARTVGALRKYLNRIRTLPAYREGKRELLESLEFLPVIGESVSRFAGQVKEAVANYLNPGQVFRDLGWNYFGPENGHDVAELETILRDLRRVEGPVLLHVVTEKGRGYHTPGNDAAHAVSAGTVIPGTVIPGTVIPGTVIPGTVIPGTVIPGTVIPGTVIPGTVIARKLPRPAPAQSGPTKVSWSKAFGRSMGAQMDEDRRIVAITAAMPDGTGLRHVAERFPERVIDVGICEQHGVGLAAGMAENGLKPVAAIYSTFLQRGYDQVWQEVVVQDLPVVFAMDRAGIVGGDGVTHQGLYDITYLRAFPNLALMAPADPPELDAMLRHALASGRPAALRYPRGSVADVPLPGNEEPIRSGRGVMLREGRDVALVAYGSMVAIALEAADLLAADGVEAAVLNARFARPLDTRAIDRLAGDVRVLFTLEEHTVNGGFGSAVLEHLAGRPAGHPRDCLVRVLGVPDRLIPHGDAAVWLERLHLDAAGIADRARRELAEAARTAGRPASTPAS